MPKPINLITISGGEMLASSGGEDSSPPATVEEIQRRLVRPSSQSSTTDSRFRNSSDEDAGYGGGSIFQVTSAEIGRDGEAKTRGMNKEKKKKKKKLEDYLDPVLLSAISSKLRRQRGDKETKPVRVCEDFKWPVEELKAFTEVSRKEKRSEWSRGAVNLNEDIDGDAVHDEDDGCNAFGQFEEIVMKLSKE